MQKLIITALCLIVFSLSGCDVPPPQPAEQTGPFYALQENGQYGYELASDRRIIMVSYLGHHNGLYQFSERRNDYLVLIYACSKPCDYYKAYQVANDGNVMAVDRYRNDPGSVINAVLMDAANGYLTPMFRNHNGQQQYLWVTDNHASWHDVTTNTNTRN